MDPYLTVLTAQTDLYNAQLTLVSAHLARLTNLVDLYRALGGGWIERTGDAPRRDLIGFEGGDTRDVRAAARNRSASVHP